MPQACPTDPGSVGCARALRHRPVGCAGDAGDERALPGLEGPGGRGGDGRRGRRGARLRAAAIWRVGEHGRGEVRPAALTHCLTQRQPMPSHRSLRAGFRVAGKLPWASCSRTVHTHTQCTGQ